MSNNGGGSAGNAFKGPSVPPTWTSSAKSGVGTAMNSSSRVWFTLSHGIFNEIYYPRLDNACTRDMGMIVTDGKSFFSEEKRNCNHQIEQMAPGVPGFRLTNTCKQMRYQMEKEILANPSIDAVLQRTTFTPLVGGLTDYHAYVLLSPHLGNIGSGNTGRIDTYKGMTMLFAERDGLALAVACLAPWVKCSAGYVGSSDGWQDLRQHYQMEWTFATAEDGNVALTGEIDLNASNGRFTLAIGFGTTTSEAGHRALSSIYADFDEMERQYVRTWQGWQQTLLPLESTAEGERDLYRVSTAVLRTHEAASFPGGFIASLSVPWGEDKGDEDLGGYHLVWPRDLVETAGGMLAAGGHGDMMRVLHYLHVTEDADGNWPQNMWLDGRFYWTGNQEDETALPILLLELAHREAALPEDARQTLWPMVRRAIGYVVRTGPVTDQDRWEEDAGYTGFTLATEIAALLVAAEIAELSGEEDLAEYLRVVADEWNDSMERWTYVIGTDLAKQHGVDGYYVRIAPAALARGEAALRGYVQIKNKAAGQGVKQVSTVVSPDSLAMVRFGLRAPDDPRILNTIKVIDATLKVETPYGPTWHRYTDDGYGEQEDGSPFDGVGIGRGWPLLTGERAHYELAAGRQDVAESLMHTMEAFSSIGGLIPEQVWDSDGIPEKELYCGRPSGSAMPLVWAHAEYIKLRRSLRDGRVFDMPKQTVQRYLVAKKRSEYTLWRSNNKRRTMPAGRTLRVEAYARARIRWSSDNWQTTHDAETRDTGIGIHYADLGTRKLAAGSTVAFTFYYPDSDRWEGQNYTVTVA